MKDKKEKQVKIYAVQWVKFEDFFIASKETKTITSDLYNKLKETRFFRHGVLKLVEEKTEDKK